MIVMLAAASILGDGSGFFLGGTLGYALFKNPNSRIFRRAYLDRTHEFYERHGGQTIIYAKFVPIIRTFAAFIAGVGKMDYARFLTFNVVGAVGWVTSMILLGDWLGTVPFVRRNFEKFVLGIIVISLIPPVLHMLQGSKKVSPAAN
jgi:membrane-associated protein